ncbi:E3 ubiquitin-protein ligase Siah2-like [Atheta coriaria]|uniref:E3 ubiquitin-protein ligase Siah2-like n=1 Tax=Dalotia coriaria TaxID=877792 RepID=UPI0031F3715E
MEALKALNDKILADFECVVCTEYMHPPIIQCIEGHSVCNECYKKLGSCPTCRQKFNTECRPLVLERLHNKIKFPCKYRESGCQEEQYGFDIQKHQIDCEFAPPKSETPPPSANRNYEHQVYTYLSMLEELADLYID